MTVFKAGVLPPLTLRRREHERPCMAEAPSARGGVWLCTLPHGHNDDHEAGNPNGRKLAQWRQS